MRVSISLEQKLKELGLATTDVEDVRSSRELERTLDPMDAALVIRSREAKATMSDLTYPGADH